MGGRGGRRRDFISWSKHLDFEGSLVAFQSSIHLHERVQLMDYVTTSKSCQVNNRQL